MCVFATQVKEVKDIQEKKPIDVDSFSSGSYAEDLFWNQRVEVFLSFILATRESSRRNRLISYTI